jgi:nicotinate-nucleotide--dimethylbenzimidazole phosphoribosyltransferase
MNLPEIPDIDDAGLAARLQAELDRKTKPLGALGALEALALRIGLILGTDQPCLAQPQLVVFAGDHGLAARGVSAYPSDVTWQMVRNFLAGGAAVSVLARQHGIALTVVAMSAAQCDAAIANGRATVAQLPGNALLVGEMGIGNTSSAALLLARLGGHAIGDCVGAGTGLDEEGQARKRTILAQVLERHAGAREPLHALAAFGGFEVATMVGAVLQAAHERRVIVVDGFIAGAAVLVASRLAPKVLQRCVFAHRSAERGHRLMLGHLGVRAGEPAHALLDLELRLGEGSGAALAWPLLVSACNILRAMATFDSAQVSGKTR